MVRYHYILRSVTRGSPLLAKLAAIRNRADISPGRERKRMLLQVVKDYKENFKWLRNVRRIHRNTRWLLESLIDYIVDEGYSASIGRAWRQIARLYRKI